MKCRICHSDGRFHNGSRVCDACRNAAARAARVQSLAESLQTVDVVVPCAPSIDPRRAYQAMSAITRRLDCVHDNGAVAIMIEPGQVRFRLFAGKMPVWMSATNHHWEPVRICDVARIGDWYIDLHGDQFHFGTPAVERLRPCRKLRITACQKHFEPHRRPQTEIVRRRLLGGGILCAVEKTGEPYRLQTGSAQAHELNWTVATPMRIYTATERDGLIVQSRPIGAGGRLGGGVAVALPGDHDLDITTEGLRTLKEAVAELGVAHHTVQFWMRRLGYDWIHSGHGRWFDESLMTAMRCKIPSIHWRKEAPRTRQHWTEDEELAIWDGITGRMPWREVAQRVGRTTKACYVAACRLRAEASLVA